MIRWKEEYRIGVDVIDQQHEKLFEIAGRAFDLLKNTFLTDKYDKMVEILEELKAYTVFHFETEEKYLEEIGYRKLFSHKIEHKEFIEKVKGIDLEELDENQEEHMLSIIEFVVDWIDHHILEKDQLFAVR